MKGNISIAKVTCLGIPEKDHISIRIEDELSAIEFVEVKISLLDFAKAITGQGCIPVEYELNGIERVGMKYESKTIEVCIPSAAHSYGLTDTDIDTSVHAYEIDGWVGNRDDCKNHHNLVKTAMTHQVYRVRYWRWVDMEKE